MESLREQFAKTDNPQNIDAYVNWLESKVHKADEDKKKVLHTFETLRKLTYNEDEVKLILSESIKYGFGCIMRGTHIQKIPSMLTEWFEANKKRL
jgi:hypothetical protein